MSFWSVRTVRARLTLTLTGLSALVGLSVNAPKAQTTGLQTTNVAGAKTATAKIVKSAEAFLATLSPQQRNCLFLRAEGLRYREIGFLRYVNSIYRP